MSAIYVQTLLETRRPLASRGSFGTGAVSFVIHFTIIAAVVYASLHPRVVEDVGRLIVDVAIVESPAPPPPDLPVVSVAPVTFATLSIPTTVLPFIPPPSQAAFDPGKYSGLGIEAAIPLARDTSRRAVTVEDAVYAVAVLEERPEQIAGSPPRYPDLLNNAGIGGQVKVEFVIDTLGRIEAGSLRVLSSTHELFTASALEALKSWAFRPGRLDGRAVRSRVNLPLIFVHQSGGRP